MSVPIQWLKSSWGTPLEGLQGGLIFWGRGLSTPQLYRNMIFCLTLRGRHKTPDFIKLPSSPIPLSPAFREVDQKAVVGCQCPWMLISPLTWGKGSRAFVLTITAELSKPSFAISAPTSETPPTVIFPCPHMHSQKSEFPNPAISMLLHRYKWWPQSSLHLPLIRWPQIGGREWTLLSQGCSATKDKTSGVWERYSRKAQLGSLRGQKQTNGLILCLYHQSWEQSCTFHW